MKLSEKQIILNGFEFDCLIGFHPHERAAKQRVVVDILLTTRLDQDGLAAGDDVTSVIDYDFMRNGIFALTKDRQFNLQETLCEEIARLCFAQPAIVRAEIATAKPDIYPDCDFVGCRMVFER